MDDLLREFLTESNENLQQLDQDLVALEQRSDDPALLHGIFRTIHTLKGTCGFLGLDRLEGVAHAAESVLDALRDGTLRVSDALITDVLAAVDTIKGILEALERTEQEPSGDDSALIARLERWMHAEAPSAASAPPPASAAPEAPEAPSAPGDAALPDAAADVHAEGRASVADHTLRVHVDVLDTLMTLVGELVLDRNRLIQLTAQRDDAVVASAVQHLDRVTSDLQDAVMKTRMQPIGGAWTKLPRLVRDLSQQSGKPLRLETQGAETELDRQILQAIGDPLTHMIRNSADHGIESPEQRRAAGKPAQGTIHLTAFHEGGHVIIEVRDDGAGISVDRVRQKAVDRGLVSREAAAAMSDQQIFRFIFEPGFSTAEKVTNVSGRGVGMDVVRMNIERIGGSVSLDSTPGVGTTVRIKIPLTLAIIPALIVLAGGRRYAIPQVNLLELVRVSGRAGEPGVEMLHGAPVYRLRGRLLPLVFLGEVLGGTRPAIEGAVLNIVVLQAEGRAFGLVVDGLRDTEEIVVKPLGRQVQGVAAFAGATIMGDGSVSLILDVPGLARQVRVVDDRQSRDAATRLEERIAAMRDLRTLLVVQLGPRDRAAIELRQVSRLEEFAPSRLEYSQGGLVAQYRGEIIPVIGLSEWFGHPSTLSDERARVPVVIHQHQGRTVGLLVDRILDIVEQELTVQRGRGAPGLAGSAAVQGRVTDLLDLDHIIASQLGQVVPRMLEAVA
jgi:two-component system chemotaxis sensor kinase CheA